MTPGFEFRPTDHVDAVRRTDEGYHNLSHHGKSAKKLTQLKAIDEWHMKLLAKLFTELKATSEDGDSLATSG